MRLLLTYLKGYWRLVAVALALATINQTFSLLDPLIFRHVIDGYATRFQDYTTAEFFQGVGLLLGMAVGVAFVSRIAKNFRTTTSTSSPSGSRPFFTLTASTSSSAARSSRRAGTRISSSGRGVLRDVAAADWRAACAG